MNSASPKSEKDPQKQLQGRLNKAKGKAFEDRLSDTFEYYRETGFMSVEKTPEPMKPIKSLGNGRFIACFEKKAQPDYKGILKGGREILFEAKFTTSEKMEQSRVKKEQAEYMTEHQNLGARCYVVIGYTGGGVYLIPWSVWDNMKEHFGRKYVKESDLEKFKVQTAWNGTLMLL